MKRIFVFAFHRGSGALCCAVIRRASHQRRQRSKQARPRRRRGLQDQEWDKAVDLLRKATALDHKYAPNLAAVYQQRGYAAATNQQFQDAISDYGEAIKINPEDPRIYEQRAAVEMKLNDMDKALADYSEAIKLKPNEVRYLNYRAYIYEQKNDLKNSMADTEKVLKLDANNQEAKARKNRLSAREAANAPFTPIPAPPKKPSPTPHRRP